MLTTRYVKPTKSDELFSRALAWLARHGLSVFGTRLLAVRGRTSGVTRTTVVNLLDVDGRRYLVAPRGATQWVRNLRAAGDAELRVGRRVEHVTATELADADKGPVLRAYLARWGWEVGRFFEGVNRRASDDDLAAIAPGFPVFAVA
ncbi:MAG TPA: nitroreductase family deazaflavin-dependent oxidoreductase [Acidimicrobiales bacterium]|nr:nitroreductase family deazaflavin-dependent oxidoreductase [Acidimicrobiales bacterium]